MRVFSRARALAIATTGVLAAAMLAVTAPLAANAADTTSISGTVTLPAGLTVAEAAPTVYVYATDGSDDPVDVVEVAADGTYHAEGLAPGTYKVYFDAPGLDAPVNVVPEWWQDAESFDTATAVNVGVAPVDHIDATLDAGATISGTVTGGGISAGWGWVLAYVEGADGLWSYYTYATIDPSGAYQLVGLRAGDYSLAFSDSGGYGEFGPGLVTGWQEWWDDTMSFDDSGSVTVGVQQNLTGIDVDLDTVGGKYTWPVISGTARVGQKLTATTGPWPAATKLVYQWYADGEPIAGAKSSTLTLTAAQFQKQIQVGVFGLKYADDPYYEAKFSDATAAVTGDPHVAISGSVAVGSTLTAARSLWLSGTTFTYQWYANGKAISKATKSTLKLTSALKAKKITVKVTGKRAGASIVRTSASTAKVATAGTPSISGTVKVGKKLTAKTGTWTGGTKFTYQWYANGVAISKATKSTFTVPKSLKGKKLTVKVTGKKSGYATVAKVSAAKKVS